MANNKTTDRSFIDYLIPYYSCEFKSALSKEEIIGRIAKKIEPEKLFRINSLFFKSSKTQDYQGAVGNSDFKISRINSKKNIYSPLITGYLIKSNQYTRVHVKMRLKLFVLILIPLWLLLATYTLTLGRNDSALAHEEFIFQLVIQLVVMLILYVVLTYNFHSMVTKNIRFLKSIIVPLEQVDSDANWITRN
tara:strand:+ start:38 stop:613 length:576 start_codon:yes stop_codon:yes gene_type:complete